MMQVRQVGKTDISLSVVGFGTAQLQMVPERQAIETLKHGFELGVNWVHTAPDYGGVEPWIARAVRESGRDIMVLTQGPAFLEIFEAFFENTCRLLGKMRLEMYGIGCIDDVERLGENVWGSGGMVEFLLRKKAEGRLKGIFCTTHGPAEYVIKLIQNNVFDAVMVAYNPLRFHLLSYFAAKEGRAFEDLGDTRKSVFPVAAAHGVSLITMKPLAGGLLCRGKAFPPHEWFPSSNEQLSAAEVLKFILNEPAVCAVVPGVASVEEAEEDGLAGYGPMGISPDKIEALEKKVERIRSTLCGRCGLCELTCSKSLAISSMFRDAYIWNYRNEIFMASDQENYFCLHPHDVLACATCPKRTCQCPQGIHIPEALFQVHKTMLRLREMGQHPGPLNGRPEMLIEGQYSMLILSREVHTRLKVGAIGLGRFLVQNVGQAMWTAFSHIPDRRVAVAIGVVVGNRLVKKVPIRQNVSPNQRSPLVFEFKAPRKPGEYDLRFFLMPLACRNVRREATQFYSGTLTVESGEYLSFLKSILKFHKRP